MLMALKKSIYMPMLCAAFFMLVATNMSLISMLSSQQQLEEVNVHQETRNFEKGGAERELTSFLTSQSSWSAEQVASYVYEMTPKEDPKRTRNLLYMSRNREQAVAEMENGHEVVRYLTNSAGLSKPQYNLLFLVQTEKKWRKSCEKRWDALLELFQLQPIIQVRVEFVNRKSDKVWDHLFSPSATESADWVFVLEDSTYVNLKRIVQRLFADIDPTLVIGKGLLHPVDGTMVPIPEAGILLSNKCLHESRGDPQIRSCWEASVNSLEDWTVCLAKKSFVWTSLPGLNPYNSREMVRYALEGSLFAGLNKTYDSVGGAMMGSARLPITYGNMLDDDMFYHQLAVDTNQGAVPKILHQIWSGPLTNIRPEIRDAAKECQKMHEELGWKYMFWDDEKLQELTGIPQLGWISEMLADKKLVRFYTDTIRLYLMHQFGGVYLDIDSFCLRPFDPLLKYMQEGTIDFLANYESERMRGRQIANGIMIAAPASPVISANALHVGIKLATHNWQKGRDFKFTGPWATTEMRDQWESWVRSHLTILSSSTFIQLYKDEGGGFDLDDVFDIATRQGSYTVQMYQTTKHRSMFKLIQQAKSKTDARNLTKLDVNKLEAKEINSVSDSAQPSSLMIVAHADDEVLWGGEYLLEEHGNVHVVVTSTQGRDTSTRYKEFKAVQQQVGFHGEFLDGKDTMRSKDIESHIQERIRGLVCDQSNNWDRIITHSPEGEYGHPQHQVVHDSVFTTMKECYGSYDKLFVFEPHVNEKFVISRAKAEVAKLYKSQKTVIFDTFRNWKERIVPFKDFDFRGASGTCITAANLTTSRKSRACRLHKKLDLSSSNDQIALQWERLATEKVIGRD